MSNEFEKIVYIEYGNEKIPVSLSFRDRKRLTISVHPDGKVTALAPGEQTRDEVVAHLRKRQPWIVRQLRHFKQFHPLPLDKHFVSGETHLYLGRQYRLKLKASDTTEVKLTGGFLHVSVPAPSNPAAVANALTSWYRARAEIIFLQRLEQCSNGSFSNPGKPSVHIRKMKTRWGSCSKGGTITLNTELIKAPIHCIDYVITHELCHLKIHDHSPSFYRLLSRRMPDWKKRKERLDFVGLT